MPFLRGQDAASVIVDFARREHITQIFLNRGQKSQWRLFRPPSLSSAILRLAQDMQVTVVAQRGVGGAV